MDEQKATCWSLYILLILSTGVLAIAVYSIYEDVIYQRDLRLELDSAKNGLKGIKKKMQEMDETFTGIKDEWHEMSELKYKFSKVVDEFNKIKDEWGETRQLGDAFDRLSDLVNTVQQEVSDLNNVAKIQNELNNSNEELDRIKGDLDDTILKLNRLNDFDDKVGVLRALGGDVVKIKAGVDQAKTASLDVKDDLDGINESMDQIQGQSKRFLSAGNKGQRTHYWARSYFYCLVIVASCLMAS